MNLTNKAKTEIVEHFSALDKGDDFQIGLAIDATCGNGHDSVFLASIAKQLLGFDIQQAAIENTQSLIDKTSETQVINCEVQLLNRGHETLLASMEEFAAVKTADVIMFNLGYLPKSDDMEITTTAKTTKQAIEQSIQALSKQGIITLLCYRGHPQGAEEFHTVQDVLEQLDTNCWKIKRVDANFPSDSTPVLFCVSRKLNNKEL